MISRVIFDLEVDDYVYVDMIVDLKQPFGTDYTTEPLEVAAPQGGYRGFFPHAEFTEAARGLLSVAVRSRCPHKVRRTKLTPFLE